MQAPTSKLSRAVPIHSVPVTLRQALLFAANTQVVGGTPIGDSKRASLMAVVMGMLLLSSAATAQAQITVTPAVTTFADQQVFTSSPPKPVVLGNTGGQPVIVDSISTIEPSHFMYSRDNCGPLPFTIAAQSTCTLQVTFNPGFEGSHAGGFDVYGTGHVLLALIPLTGRAVQGKLEVSPSGSMVFSPTAVGTTSAQMTALLRSTGSGPIEVLSITPATTPFARVGGTCGTPPFSLPEFGSCTLTYAFSPTQAGTGQAQTLVFKPPAAVWGSRSLTLSGDATQGSQTITFPAQLTRTYGPGYSFPVNPPATTNSGLAVTYGSTTPTFCTATGNMVAVVAAGTCTLTANQAGNASWAAAAQQAQSFAITRASQTLTFPAQIANSRTFVPGGSFAINPTATSTTPNAGQPIVYSSVDNAVCTVNGSNVTMVAAGTCIVAANQAGNANYNAAAQVTVRVQLALFAHGFETP